jgi:virulence factor Mce-like protein
MRLLRFDGVPERDKPNMGRIGAVFLIVLGVVLYAGYSRHVPLLPKGGAVVSAEFRDASNVRAATVVRIHGVDVGKVETIEGRGSGAARRAVVKMRIDNASDADLLRADATASIYWRTLLGRNMYIELDPGTATRGLGSSTIPTARTQTQVELDQALKPLDASGRKGLQKFMAFVDDGFALSAAPRTVIDRLGPAMRAVAPATRALRGERTGDLIAAVRSTRDVVRTLDDVDGRLGGLIDSGAVTLGVAAARRADIARSLAIAPRALDSTRREMVSLRTTLDRVDPVADELRPGARKLDDASRALEPALVDLRPLLRDAKPLLRDVDPAVERLKTTAERGVPLIRQLTPTVARLDDELLPFLNERQQPSGRKVYETVGPTISTLASLAQNFDANGHDVAFQTGVGARLLEGFAPCSVHLTDPTARQKVVCDGFAKGLNELFGGVAAARTHSRAAGVPGRAGHLVAAQRAARSGRRTRVAPPRTARAVLDDIFASLGITHEKDPR